MFVQIVNKFFYKCSSDIYIYIYVRMSVHHAGKKQTGGPRLCLGGRSPMIRLYVTRFFFVKIRKVMIVQILNKFFYTSCFRAEATYLVGLVPAAPTVDRAE